MTIEIKGTHGYSLSDKTRIYIEKKIQRLEHVKEHIADLHIIIDRETSTEFKTGTNIHFRWGTMEHIEVTNRDLFKAIDQLFDKIDTKVTKEKEKIQNHQ